MVILWKRQLEFSNIQNRWTAIKLGEAVRLCAWCLSIVVMSTVPLVPRVIQNDSPITNYINIAKISSFSGALE